MADYFVAEQRGSGEQQQRIVRAEHLSVRVEVLPRLISPPSILFDAVRETHDERAAGTYVLRRPADANEGVSALFDMRRQCTEVLSRHLGSFL
jgi:hypothetical protein